jgi:ribonucleotide reductase alpha subunit
LFNENGSVQNIPEIPTDIKEVYKTVWEMKGKSILEMARDRSYFIDQSQSLNMFMAEPTASKLSSAHMYGWKLGLKTGMYYLRTKAATDAIKFTVDKKYQEAPKATPAPAMVASVQNKTADEIALEQATIACSLDNPDACEMCSG